MRDYDDNFKKRRQDFTINIRRNHRQQLFNKRRNLDEYKLSDQLEQPQKFIIDERYHQQIQQMINTQYTRNMFDQLVTFLNSPDYLTQLRGIIGLRKVLSIQQNPPINQFIDRGLLNKSIQLIKQKQFPQFRLESTWILTNIAAGQKQHCQKLVQKGVIDILLSLLVQNQKGIVDQAIWGIGNLSADDIKYRDQILKKGGMQILIKIVNTSQNKTLIRNGAWAITNLCRGDPPANIKLIQDSCQLLCNIIKSGLITQQYIQVISDILWAISHITEDRKSKIQVVYHCGILHQIFQYSLSQYASLQIPSIKLIGNFSLGNQNHMDALIKQGIFDLSLILLNNKKKSIRRQMCWILSNLAAGVYKQVQIFMSRKQLFDKISLLFHQDQIQVQIQICWIFPNLGYLGNRNKVTQICLQYDIISIYSKILQQTKPIYLTNALDALFKLMLLGKKCELQGKNLIIEKFLDSGGGNRLQQLQKHPNKGVYQSAIKILIKFFELQNSNTFS